MDWNSFSKHQQAAIIKYAKDTCKTTPCFKCPLSILDDWSIERICMLSKEGEIKGDADARCREILKTRLSEILEGSHE